MREMPALSSRNRLLTSLSPDDFVELSERLKPVQLEMGKVLYETGGKIDYIYFPENTIVSTVSSLKDGFNIETGVTGNEGMTGFSALLSDGIAKRTSIVQISGDGWKMATADFQKLFNRSESLRCLVLSYVNSFFEQIAQSKICLSRHLINQRLARWLLMCNDRVSGTEFKMVQDLMAQMLGVNRPCLSAAAAKLKNQGLIKYVRGKITILDRKGLENASCECYEPNEKISEQYRAVLELKNLRERMKIASAEVVEQKEFRRKIKIETAETLAELNRIRRGEVKTPERIKICSVCEKICDRDYTRLPAEKLSQKILFVLSSSGICKTCAANQ